MKRVVIIIASVLVVLALAVGGVFASAFMGNTTIVDGAVLAPGVYTVKDGFVAAFILDVDAGHVALIDAGNDDRGRAILAALQRRGLGPDAVRAIFLTHGHPDHTKGVHLFPRADVYALAADVALVEGRAAARSPMAHFLPAPKLTGIHVTHALTDRETVQVGPLGVRVFAVPGHTPGSAAFLARDVLFIGDSASGTTKGTMRAAVWAFSESTEQNIASLRALAARLRPDAERIRATAFAHSGAFPGIAALEAFAAAH